MENNVSIINKGKKNVFASKKHPIMTDYNKLFVEMKKFQIVQEW